MMIIKERYIETLLRIRHYLSLLQSIFPFTATSWRYPRYNRSDAKRVFSLSLHLHPFITKLSLISS